MTIINAAWIDPDSKSYFTHNSKYYSDKDRIEQSFPGMFSEIGFKSIDAALIGAGSRKGKVYFFRVNHIHDLILQMENVTPVIH